MDLDREQRQRALSQSTETEHPFHVEVRPRELLCSMGEKIEMVISGAGYRTTGAAKGAE